MHLKQNSSKWLEWRTKGIGASDAPIILGVSPWKTPYKLWLEKMTGQSDFKGNEATERGHALEDVARQCAEKQLDTLFFPQCLEHEKFDWMRASLDGINLDKKILEIKCPFRPENPNSDHQLAKQGKIPEKYWPQLQHQLEVAKANEGWYFSFDGVDGVSIPFNRDDKYIADLLEKERIFWECVQMRTPPKMTEKDYKIIEEADALKKSQKILKLRKNLEAIHAELDPLEEELKEKYCQDMCAVIGNLKFTRFVRKGNVNYGMIKELQDVDLEKYRNSSIVTVRISSISD